MEVCPYIYFQCCRYFWGPWLSFVITDEFSVRVTKISSRIGVSWTYSLPFYFLSILTHWITAIISRRSKRDNFELYKSLKLSFANTWGFHSNFMKRESFLKLTSPETETDYSMWDKPGWFNWFSQLLCEVLSSFKGAEAKNFGQKKHPIFFTVTFT